MNYFDYVSKFYNAGDPSYTDEKIKVFVKAGMITAAQYQEITGKAYTE